MDPHVLITVGFSRSARPFHLPGLPDCFICRVCQIDSSVGSARSIHESARPFHLPGPLVPFHLTDRQTNYFKFTNAYMYKSKIGALGILPVLPDHFICRVVLAVP